MANDINQVILIGRLTKNAELKFTNSGTPVTRLSLAVNRRKKSGDNWEDEVNFFDVILWGKIAERLTEYLKKGKQIGVTGELRQNRWEQDGNKRSRVEIVADNIQLLGGKSQESNQSQSDGNDSSEEFDNSDIPF